MSAPTISLGIDQILEDARARIRRYSPAEAASAIAAGALLVDIRPQAQREEFGEVPGALVIERNVLEWRLDPRSDARIVDVADHSTRVIVLCQEGYTSSLAADSLRTLGLNEPGDVDGGFAAWRDSGLPTTL